MNYLDAIALEPGGANIANYCGLSLVSLSFLPDASQVRINANSSQSYVLLIISSKKA